MEINLNKKRLLTNRIKELESQLEEKSFILKTIKHQEAETQQKLPKKLISFVTPRVLPKNLNLPNLPIPTFDTLTNIAQTPILPKPRTYINACNKRANSTGRKAFKEEKENPNNETQNEGSFFLMKEYKEKNEKLKLKVKKLSEKFLLELSNKEREILELKKFKNSYNVLLEKFKAIPSNINGGNSKIETLTIENECLKDELAILRNKVDEKDQKIMSSDEENLRIRENMEKMMNKLKFIMIRKQALEKELMGYQEKSFQTNLLIKKLENDVNDKASMIGILKNQLIYVGSNLEFETKRPESTKNVF